MQPRPWTALYPAEDSFEARFSDGLSLLRHAVQQARQQPALHYFDATLSYGELDALTDAFASFLVASGIAPGDRVALYLQNTPAFVIGLVGAWKAGAVAVTINPMSRARELRALLQDSGARLLVAHRDLYLDVVQEVLPDFEGLRVVTASARDFQSRNDPRVFDKAEPPAPENTADLLATLKAHEGRSAPPVRADADGAAMLVYTSGTTGVPKGAVITHRNVAFNADMWRAFCSMRDGRPILAVAPLFHITGSVGHLAAAFACAAPMVLAMRFHPEVMAEAAHEHQAEFAVGAITAYIAMMNAPGVKPEHLASLKQVYSGGAPVPAAVAAEFERRFGHYVHSGYGLTETSSIAVAVPPGRRAPIDTNGSLSVGIPVYGTDCYIAADDGRPLAAGEVGEILLRGPEVIREYWNKPADTAAAFHDGFLRTGDVGYLDAEGWLYIVDRKKDMIIASGYKVWPKEVEDVLYTHPAIREAAVVGVADAYRGETVKAVVSLKPGQQLDEEGLRAYCRERMAAYKVPRIVQVLPDLPKTVTGKILRRELR